MKKWYQSKTIWFSILYGIVNIAGIFGFANFNPDPQVVSGVGLGVAIIIYVLRLMTGKKIQ